jgi:hypothetical protein
LCGACEAIVATVVADAGIANVTVAGLATIANTACHAFCVGVALKECGVITTSIADIVGWATQGISTSAICQKLKLCVDP